MRTNELSGAALDWAVAKCKGVNERAFLLFYEGNVEDNEPPAFHYSTDWAAGGAIIEREKISIYARAAGNFIAYMESDEGSEQYGATPLIAAMRCYVASKLGDEVQIPEGL
jgi:hypothetical protein